MSDALNAMNPRLRRAPLDEPNPAKPKTGALPTSKNPPFSIKRHRPDWLHDLVEKPNFETLSNLRQKKEPSDLSHVDVGPLRRILDDKGFDTAKFDIARQASEDKHLFVFFEHLATQLNVPIDLRITNEQGKVVDRVWFEKDATPKPLPPGIESPRLRSENVTRITLWNDGGRWQWQVSQDDRPPSSRRVYYAPRGTPRPHDPLQAPPGFSLTPRSGSADPSRVTDGDDKDQEKAKKTEATSADPLPRNNAAVKVKLEEILKKKREALAQDKIISASLMIPRPDPADDDSEDGWSEGEDSVPATKTEAVPADRPIPTPAELDRKIAELEESKAELAKEAAKEARAKRPEPSQKLLLHKDTLIKHDVEFTKGPNGDVLKELTKFDENKLNKNLNINSLFNDGKLSDAALQKLTITQTYKNTLGQGPRDRKIRHTCWFMAGLEAMTRTPIGREALRENVSLDPDRNRVTVNFPGFNATVELAMVVPQRNREKMDTTDSKLYQVYSDSDPFVDVLARATDILRQHVDREKRCVDDYGAPQTVMRAFGLDVYETNALEFTEKAGEMPEKIYETLQHTKDCPVTVIMGEHVVALKSFNEDVDKDEGGTLHFFDPMDALGKDGRCWTQLSVAKYRETARKNLDKFGICVARKIGDAPLGKGWALVESGNIL